MQRLWKKYGGNAMYVGLLLISLGDLHRDLVTSPRTTPVATLRYQRQWTSVLMLRLICVSYLLAFASMFAQIKGLCGQGGLFPLRTSLDQIARWSAATKWNMDNPGQWISLLLAKMTQLMLSSAAVSDANLNYAMQSSCIASAIGVMFPYPIVFVYLYLSYYSLKRVTAQVTNLQWDSLLLESGVTAILLSTAVALHNAKLIIICNWILKLLLFRLMFGSGFVKIHSSDPSWKHEGGYTAMTYHFLTQPLPNWASVYMHRLPRWALQAMTIGTIVLEVIVPLLSWAPYPLFAWTHSAATVLGGLRQTPSIAPVAVNTSAAAMVMAAVAVPALAGVGAARAVQAASAVVYAQLMLSIACTGNFGA